MRRGLVLDLHLGGRTLGAGLLAVALGLALAVSAGLVEGARHGLVVALGLALREGPVVLLPLLPALVAAGAGLAAAVTVQRGEAEALESMGIAPLRAVRGPALVGGLLGLLATGLQDRAAPVLARDALALRAAVAEAPATAWTWLPADDGGGALVSLADGQRLVARDGRLARTTAVALDPELHRRALALALPAVAGGAELSAGASPAQHAELWQRRLRPLLCGLLVVLVALGPGGGRTARFGPALVLGLCAQAAVVVATAAASAGHLSPWLAAAIPPAAALGAFGLLRLSGYSTISHTPE